MKLYLSFRVGVLISLLITAKGTCQTSDPKKDSASSLMLVNTSNNEHIGLGLGQKLNYRLHGSDEYVRATITDISGSTISFQGKDKKTVSIEVGQLAVFKIPRSQAKRTTGTVLTVIGGLATFIGLASIPAPAHDNTGTSGGLHTAGLIVGAVGIPMLAGGIALKSWRKIDLEKGTWKLTHDKTGKSPVAMGFTKHPPRFGVQMNYSTSSIAGLGIGGHGEFFINEKISFQPAFDYYFPKEAVAGTGVKASSWTINGDVHFYFTNSRSAKIYGLGGITFLGYTDFSYFASPIGSPPSSPVGTNTTVLGANLGIGSTFGDSGIHPFAELKYNSALSGMVITGGVKFGKR